MVASGLLSRKAVLLSAEKGNYQNVDELSECMKASMLLPGVTGDVVRLKGSQAASDDILKTLWMESTKRGDNELSTGSEPLSDALIFEPIPYRSAIKENCTHIIALRTRADDISVTVKMSVMEKMILARFFGRKQNLPELVDWMHNQVHHHLAFSYMRLLLRQCSLLSPFCDNNNTNI